mmetsp:Transcript_7087/g.17109  ORF Transcript_7087/g.17109 Transcript_7087/m.17109 type:complete len:210 (+) Transcript_7087:699-1328(+)
MKPNWSFPVSTISAPSNSRMATGPGRSLSSQITRGSIWSPPKREKGKTTALDLSKMCSMLMPSSSRRGGSSSRRGYDESCDCPCCCTVVAEGINIENDPIGLAAALFPALFKLPLLLEFPEDIIIGADESMAPDRKGCCCCCCCCCCRSLLPLLGPNIGGGRSFVYPSIAAVLLLLSCDDTNSMGTTMTSVVTYNCSFSPSPPRRLKTR